MAPWGKLLKLSRLSQSLQCGFLTIVPQFLHYGDFSTELVKQKKGPACRVSSRYDGRPKALNPKPQTFGP